MRLSDDELKAVLARAEEIERASPRAQALRAELEAVVGAGEAVGLSRSAVERAFLERTGIGVEPPGPGSLAFAESADGKYYAAEVLAVEPGAIHVRFLRGGEHVVAPDRVRPCSFLPGEKVVVDWPWWGPWTCTVVSYDADRGWVEVTDGWGDTRSFRIAEVWLNPSKPPTRRTRVTATLLAVGAGAGAIIGSIVTALLFP